MSGTFRSCLAEFAGTFALVWLAAGAACAGLGPLGAALAYGLALAVVTHSFRSSEAHFNPAITAALGLIGRLDRVRAVFLVACQLLGAGFAGLFLVKSYGAAASAGNCVLAGVGFRMGTLIEAMTAFWVTIAFCRARLDGSDSGAAAVGAAASACALATGSLTGGAFNPARAFGPALAVGNWTHWYVFWAGPLVGAAAAALCYDRLFADKKETL